MAVGSTQKDPDSATPCCQRLKQEFRVKNFLLEYDRPGEFARAHCGASVFYLFWRLFWACYNVALIGVSAHLSQFFAATQADRVKWPIFLTNWGLVCNAVVSILDLINSFYMYCNRRDLLEGQEGSMPWYLKASWVLYSFANSKAIVVSFVYWFFLFNPSVGFEGYRILPFLTHGTNLIFMVLNLLVTDMPVRLLHFYFPTILCFIYIVFNVIYTVAGGTNDEREPFIYPILDWNNSPLLATGAGVAAVVGGAVGHVIVYFLFLFRVYAFRCCRTTKV